MRPDTFDYDIHGILRIRSARRLPELGFFRVQGLSRPPDIEVRVVADPDRQGGQGTVRYAEAFGRYGFQLAIDRDEARTRVFVSRLLGLSPHVLYTNVVEPLVRWAFVRKGYAMMHGATIAFGERALFITARTDTGKTTTILQTLRRHLDDCRFLSDDMTIFQRDAVVLSYPKPLTISQHTLSAVGGAPLSTRERLFLQVQSRLHSRGGRRAGMRMKDAGLPAATMSAVVQRLIPPPKYMIDRLVPGARYAESARLARIVLIERGPEFERELENAAKLAALAENSEDAYGFPPYPQLARALSSWHGQDLHERERAIVASAVAGVPGVHLGSSRYDWYRRLPELAGESSGFRVAPSFGPAAERKATIPS